MNPDDLTHWTFSLSPPPLLDDPLISHNELFPSSPAPLSALQTSSSFAIAEHRAFSSVPSSECLTNMRRSSDTGMESSRGFRHMMRERQRRESLSQSYADLRSILSSKTKGDKVSIVQEAGEHLVELQKAREKLRRRNKELEMAASRNFATGPKAPSVEVCIANPSSPIGSMIAALRCLKQMELEVTAVRSSSGGRDWSMEVSICDWKVEKYEVERAMKTALMQVEEEDSIACLVKNTDPDFFLQNEESAVPAASYGRLHDQL
ncbi:transcription factor BHLH148-like [Curcuma longa]|uniref:transcription factor BHLH148-like n=1 Tax=Curcuma longa TaxID=136217 RepID=UPI003D9F5941